MTVNKIGKKTNDGKTLSGVKRRLVKFFEEAAQITAVIKELPTIEKEEISAAEREMVNKFVTLVEQMENKKTTVEVKIEQIVPPAEEKKVTAPEVKTEQISAPNTE